MIRRTQLLCIALAAVTLLAVLSSTGVVTAQAALTHSSGKESTSRPTFDQLFGLLRGGWSSLVDNIVTWLSGSGTKVGGSLDPYDSCWHWVPTANGWRWVNVCV
ncbi:MAG: hypothetical protein ACXV3E_03050 [Halobacteriota archaeon]